MRGRCLHSSTLSSSAAILFPFSSATFIKMNHVFHSLCSEVTASEHRAICTESLEKAIKIVGAASTQIPWLCSLACHSLSQMWVSVGILQTLLWETLSTEQEINTLKKIYSKSGSELSRLFYELRRLKSLSPFPQLPLAGSVCVNTVPGP